MLHFLFGLLEGFWLQQLIIHYQKRAVVELEQDAPLLCFEPLGQHIAGFKILDSFDVTHGGWFSIYKKALLEQAALGGFG